MLGPVFHDTQREPDGAGTLTDEGLSFLDRISHFSDISRNGNRGSIRAYQNNGGFPLAGLTGAFFELCYRITDYPIPNPKPGIYW